MKKTLLAGIITLAATSAVGCSDRFFSAQASTDANGSAAVQRGQYLVTIAGCNDCHTPLKMGPKGPEPDMSRFLSGHPEQMGALQARRPEGPWLWTGAATNTAFSGPWGVSYAANLTPDRNTGLGIWTEEMFVTAIRTGRHMGTSREILPPMPWPSLRKANDQDLKAIYAYLRSVKPLVNHVPDAQLVGVATDAH